jgi:hypothetical protein
MNNPVLPDPKKVQKTVTELQDVCRQFDALNLTLDAAIAHIDEEIKQSPLTLYHLKKRHETQSA